MDGSGNPMDEFMEELIREGSSSKKVDTHRMGKKGGTGRQFPSGITWKRT